jgi:hypothetical protein
MIAPYPGVYTYKEERGRVQIGTISLPDCLCTD